jgi:hypothetical protein
VEAVVAIAIVVVVTTGAWGLFLTIQQNWLSASLAMRTATEAGVTLQKIIYGDGNAVGSIREAVKQDVSFSNTAGGGWELVLDGTNAANRIIYEPASNRIVHANGYVYSSNVVASTAAKPNDGCEIEVTVQHVEGSRTNSSTMSTYVRFRNRK